MSERLPADPLTFGDKRLEFMQRAQEAHMLDRCTLHYPTSEGTDGYNVPVLGDQEFQTQCGYDASGGREVSDGSETVVADAALRLPLAMLPYVSKFGKIEITERHGRRVDPPLVFEMIGDPDEGPSGIVLTLRRVS